MFVLFFKLNEFVVILKRFLIISFVVNNIEEGWRFKEFLKEIDDRMDLILGCLDNNCICCVVGGSFLLYLCMYVIFFLFWFFAVEGEILIVFKEK